MEEYKNIWRFEEGEEEEVGHTMAVRTCRKRWLGIVVIKKLRGRFTRRWLRREVRDDVLFTFMAIPLLHICR